MTIIQPNKNKNFLIRFGILLSLPLFGGVILLIMLYNQTVNFEHNFSLLDAKFKNVQAANAELKDKFFGLFVSENLEKLANDRGLVKEKNPQYIEVHPKWEVASHY